MEWEPEEQAWHSYINFELRYKELDRARMIYERYILSSLTSDRCLSMLCLMKICLLLAMCGCSFGDDL